MTAVTFTGLSSGIDTASLVTKLVAAERAPADAIASRQSDLAAQKSIVGSLSSALAALATAARGMDIATEVQPRTAVSSDSHVSVAASSGAAATVHDVRVTQLARGQITASRTFTSADAGVLGDGTLLISGLTDPISYSSTDSLADIAGKINNSGAAVSASVLFDGTNYRLMVASTATGTAAAPVFTDGGDGLDLSNPANIKVPARDAIAMIDGVQITRGSNVIDDAVAGLTFTLASPHPTDDLTASTQVQVTLDSKSVTDKLKSLVSAYNAVNSALHVQLDYTGTKKGTNTLFGDSTLRQLQGAIGSVMSSGYGDNNATLGGIGLVRSKDGSLTLDETKLASALAANPNAVGDLFVTGGFATAMATLADNYSRGGDGILALKAKALSDRSTVLQSQADQINARADALQTQLEKQFTALETAMTQLKSQGSFLSSILG